MTDIELFRSLEGLDEDGNSNAVFTASIQGLDDKGEQVTLDSAGTDNADIRFSLVPGGISVIDVMFYDATEYDYLQLVRVLDRYTTEANIALSDENGVVPALLLSLMPVGDYEEFLVCTEAQWTYFCDDPSKAPTGLRFIFLTDNLHHVTLDSDQSEEAVVAALDETEY